MTSTYKVLYTSIDGARKVGTFKTLKGARAFAHKWVGRNADCGSSYAVSADGIGKIQALQGCNLADLFGSYDLAVKLNAPVAGAAIEPKASELLYQDCELPAVLTETGKADLATYEPPFPTSDEELARLMQWRPIKAR